MEGESSVSTPRDVKLVLDKSETNAKTDKNAKASVRYTGEGVESNGEVSSSSVKQTQPVVNGSNGDYQNGVAKGSPGDDGIVKPAPAESTWTVKADGAVQLLMGSSEITSRVPITVVQALQAAVRVSPQRVALGVKRNGDWVKWTYKEYYDSVCTAGKAFIKLGLKPFHGVGILGFNSPEWLISDLGAIFAGGLAVGIYATNSPEACQYVAENCKANVLVVENNAQLQKILQVWDSLPELNAVVQYLGEIEGERSQNVYSWKEFMELGKEVSDETLQARMDELVPNRCCTLVYTSGTTGNPKGVMLSHDNLVWTAWTCLKHMDCGHKGPEHIVSYLPLSHIAAQELDIFMPITLVASVWFAQPDALKGSLVQTMREVRPTRFFGVPRVYEKIMEKMKAIGQANTGMKRKIGEWAKSVALKGNTNLEQGRSLPFGWTIATTFLKKVRVALGLDRCLLCFVGAAPVTMETLKYFQSINIPVYELYGMSETSGPHSVSIPGHVISGSCGILMEGVEMKIADKDEEGNGELCIKGRHVFMGYLWNEEKTKESLDESGWLHTGDVARIDKNGQLYITGRIKELIITAGGENIPPVPIEKSIKAEIPLISNAMIIGDKRKFLSCLLTLKVNVNPDNGVPSDDLTPFAIEYCKSIGSKATTVSEILSTKDEKVMKAIQDGLDRANEHAVSRAQKVQKFLILEKDFSLPGGELGPTLKLRRPVVVKKFKDQIESLYPHA